MAFLAGLTGSSSHGPILRGEQYMGKIRYSVAMSLDGFIAGRNGEYDWITMDPDIDFGEVFSRYDTVLMGCRTFETTLKRGGNGANYIQGAAHPNITS